MRYLSIKNFAKHQHYKDRRPPWIKLHAELLDDYAFTCLQDASKAHLMLLWVLASKLDNRIPYDLAFLTRKLGATVVIDVEELVLHGFIEVSQDDSTPLASRKQSAMPETETETETETASSPKKATTVRVRAEPTPDVLPKPLCDAAYERYIARIGAVDYGRFRKALLPIYRSAQSAHPSEAELGGAIEAFKEARDADDPRFRAKYTIESLAGSLHEYVRIGAMPLVDDWGEPTERGKVARVFA